MTDWTGRRFEVDVGPVAHGGHCVARHDGRVVFVRHALPGERVLAAVTEDRGGSFCRADAVEIRHGSPDRVTPPCPLSGPGGCGGCDWQHVTAGRQRALKAAVVAEQLHRLAGLDREVLVEELPGGPLGWRTRTRLAVDRDGRAGFRVHRGHRVVPVDRCPIAAPGTVDAVTEQRWTPGTELDIAVDADARSHVRRLRPRSDRGGRARPAPRQPATAGPWVTGDGVAVERAAGRRWRVAADGFWQAHPHAADTYARVVADWAVVPPDRRGHVVWDLYAGAGLFTAVLAEATGAAGTVVAIESDRDAARHAVGNLADLAPRTTVRVVTDRVERALRDADLPDPGVVVLDPPRKGAGRTVVDAVATRRPERVVYVACDPAALARDVATFAAHGYELAELRAFDAFPMTHHVECLALLTAHPD